MVFTPQNSLDMFRATTGPTCQQKTRTTSCLLWPEQLNNDLKFWLSSASSINAAPVAAPKPTAATDVCESTSSIGGKTPSGGRFTLPPNLRSPDSGSWLATRNSGHKKKLDLWLSRPGSETASVKSSCSSFSSSSSSSSSSASLIKSEKDVWLAKTQTCVKAATNLQEWRQSSKTPNLQSSSDLENWRLSSNATNLQEWRQPSLHSSSSRVPSNAASSLQEWRQTSGKLQSLSLDNWRVSSTPTSNLQDSRKTPGLDSWRFCETTPIDPVEAVRLGLKKTSLCWMEGSPSGSSTSSRSSFISENSLNCWLSGEHSKDMDEHSWDLASEASNVASEGSIITIGPEDIMEDMDEDLEDDLVHIQANELSRWLIC